jgi:hypothetical protein
VKIVSTFVGNSLSRNGNLLHTSIAGIMEERNSGILELWNFGMMEE